MIYDHVFGFTRPPFERGLQSDELFRAPLLDELHQRLLYLVETRATGLLTDEPGSGKSTALRRLRDELHPEQMRTLYLHDTAVNPGDFCRQIALELGLEPSFSRALTLRAIQQEIARLADERHLTVLLVLDEAQGLRPDVLALLPLLTNFEWDNRAPLAVLLAGQSGLRQILFTNLSGLGLREAFRRPRGKVSLDPWCSPFGNSLADLRRPDKTG
ncbi:MAG: ATP-binding protein [bacterium]|nr:ATP-binding protein [bacterium]